MNGFEHSVSGMPHSGNSTLTTECSDIWSKTLLHIQNTVGTASFKTWISKLHLINFDNNTLNLYVNSNFVKDTILAKYSDEILKSVQVYAPRITSVDIVVIEDEFKQHEHCTLNSNKVDRSATESNKFDYLSVPGSLFNKSWQTKLSNTASSEPITKIISKNVSLDKKFTFENFVVDQSNEFAYVATKDVARNSTVNFNPLFLYGGVGMGKTHLIQAIAWYKRKNQSNKKVLYVSAERFMYLFLKSLRLKNGINFKDFFKDVDVLIMDDIQFICGKESTQEEFLHVFNKFASDDHQIILSANKAPGELTGLSNTLKSRLSGGLVVDVHPSTYELRVKILQQKSKQLKIQIPECVVDKLACNITSSVRELEGALNRLVAHSTLIGKNISLEMIKDVLDDLPIAKEHTVSLQSIQSQVCGSFSISLSEMLSQTRIKTVAVARQVAMYLTKELTNYSYSEIGKLFGNRNHSTVIYAVKSIKNRIREDFNFLKSIESLKKSL